MSALIKRGISLNATPQGSLALNTTPFKEKTENPGAYIKIKTCKAGGPTAT